MISTQPQHMSAEAFCITHHQSVLHCGVIGYYTCTYVRTLCQPEVTEGAKLMILGFHIFWDITLYSQPIFRKKINALFAASIFLVRASLTLRPRNDSSKLRLAFNALYGVLSWKIYFFKLVVGYNKELHNFQPSFIHSFIS
jgi:hypothetical protein